MLKHFVAAMLAVCPLILTHAQGTLTVERDLNSDWLTYTEEGFFNAGEKSPDNTVYLRLPLNRLKGRYLSVESERPYFIFIDGRLSGEYQHETLLPVDSLVRRYGSTQISLAIYQRNLNARELRTNMLVPETNSETNPYRPDSWFRDFATVAGILIVAFFVLISRMNPKLASDYLSVGGIIAFRESDDVHANARLTNSSNLQFYLACSLLLGYYLLIVFQHLPDGYISALYFRANGFWSAMGQWLKLSAVVLLMFTIKITLVFGLTRLFDMRGLTRVHFFNWMRLLLVVIGAASMVLFFYFISRGQDPRIFSWFLLAVVVTLAAWVAILFLKLSGSREHSMFHLFSYICATELIPLFITIKVFFH